MREVETPHQIHRRRFFPKAVTVYKMLIFSIFFDAYALFFIGDFPVQLYHFAFVLVVIWGLLLLHQKATNISKPVLCLCVFLAWMWICLIVTRVGNYDGVLLLSLMCLMAILSRRELTEKDFHSLMASFSRGMNLMAVYGILQLLFRFVDFHIGSFYPGDLWIDNHMVPGFNWSNDIYISNLLLSRSNAVFREPSGFSMLLSFNMFLLIHSSSQNVLSEKRQTKKIIWIVINAVSYLCTFSGSGVIVGIAMLVGSFFMTNAQKRRLFIKNFLRIVVISAIAYLVISLFFEVNSIFEYLFSRIGEITDSQYSSGATRFVYSYYLLLDALLHNFLCGYGPVGIEGLKSIAQTLTVNGWVTASNGIVQLGTQYGAVSLALTACLYISLKDSRNAMRQMIYSYICISLLVVGSSDPVYWIFISLLMLKIKPTPPPSALGKKSFGETVILQQIQL